jgi:hypothetical protein
MNWVYDVMVGITILSIVSMVVSESIDASSMDSK